VRNIQSGAAVIMALLVTALAVAAATALLVRLDHWVQTVTVARNYAQALELARGGLAYGRAILTEDLRQNNIDHPDEDWARRLPPFSAEGGELGGSIEDMQGRWNLNNLLEEGGAVDPVALGVYRRLLLELGLDASLADSLADWLDSDGEARPGGAESPYYLAQPGAYPAANAPLDHLNALQRIRGYDQGVVDRLAPFVSVLPGRREVNVNTATAEVIAAIQPGLNLAEAREFVRARRGAWFRDGIDYRTRLARDDLPSNETPVGGSSRYFLVHATARYGDAEARLQALVEREPGLNQPRILWQSEQ
jgi:general secretion pathway protein K